MPPQDGQQIKALFNTGIVEGETYPQDKPLSDEAFTAYWLNRDAFVVRVVEDNNIQQ